MCKILKAVLQCIVAALFFASAVGFAAGLDSRKNNQIILYLETDESRPDISIIFSRQPISGIIGNRQVSQAVLRSLRERTDVLVLNVGDKTASGKNRFDYFFGQSQDAGMKWNDGRNFHSDAWRGYDDDIWDNIAIASNSTRQGAITKLMGLVVRRGGVTLYDSRAKKSFLNNIPIDVSFTPRLLLTGSDGSTYAEFGQEMKSFRTVFYETGSHPILVDAYSDLAQTDRKKFTAFSEGWCSEFVAYLYRKQGYDFPDPNGGEINWFVLKRSANAMGGKVYPLKEIHGWSEAEKIERITPGSIVSIVTGGGTAHTLLFTQWNRVDNFASFSAISGNNNNMVWPHRTIRLPRPVDWDSKTLRDLDAWDRRSFIAVLPDMK